MAANQALTQVARILADVTRSGATAGIAVLARDGSSPYILSWLAAGSANLVPRASLVEGLAVSNALANTWTSPFMANFMGVNQTTTQQALLREPSGQKLVLYVTALAAAATPNAVRGLLRELLAVNLGLRQVAEVPENIYHTCVHSPTLKLLQQDIADSFERCQVAFSATETGNSREASCRELVIITMAFALAQKRGSKYWVRVKNLVGAEALCASLSVAFNAKIAVGFITACGVYSYLNAHASTGSSTESAVSAITSTSICFEYDNSGEVTIGICESGGEIKEYIVPEGGARRPSRNSMLGTEILSSAKIFLGNTSWISKAAKAVYAMKRLAKEVVDVLEQNEDANCKTMRGHIVDNWLKTFVKEMGGVANEFGTMRRLLDVVIVSPDDAKIRLVSEVELLAGPEEAQKLSNEFQTPGPQQIIDILILSLLKVIFGLSYTGLEVNVDRLDSFWFPSTLNALIPQVFELIPAFDVPVTTHRTFSICCSVVQCGAYVLMPRILAEEKISAIDSSPFLMVPGWLSKDDIPVGGFFYDELHEAMDMTDTRPQARIPSDASDSQGIEYFYEEAEYGYKFWTIEAGHRVMLDGLIEGILSMHSVDDEYDETAAPTTWEKAAPHHTIPPQPHKTLMLSSGNIAGRRLALSRAGTVSCPAVVNFSTDYRRALAYADRYHCNVVIL
jgi:hypothetical protein